MIVADFSWTGMISLDQELSHPVDRTLADLMDGEPLLDVSI